MDSALFFTALPVLLRGLLVTLELVSLSLLLGALLALLMSYGCLSKKPWIVFPIKTFVFFIRGTPLLVQIFLIYYGASQFEWLTQSWLWVLLKEPFFCAVVALAINSSAYTTEMFLGVVHAIPPGEVEACQVFGMSRFLMLRRIIFPRAFRIVLPAYSNEVIILVKSSSLASTITLLDLMGATQQVVNQTYASLPLFALAGILYLLINSLLMGLFKLLEQRWNQYLRIKQG